jgi:energy-coupling factor transporter ATP-binding protein EcfA2
VPFSRSCASEDRIWKADSRRTVDVALGRSGATKLQHIQLGLGTSQHVLTAGKTGSGKSTLLHVLITNLALNYSPDQIEFYLIDFKKGVEFKTYATLKLPHARVIAIESDREFGVSVLERLDGILKERGELFREHGVQDIRSFRDNVPEISMPRILLVVDEFQEFFTEDDRVYQTASLLLDRLVRQGRAFGIHVMLGSQTLGGAYSLARTTISQMAVRIALQCSETDAHLILSEDNTAARLLTRPGEAIYNDANGMLEGNSLFQIAWLTDDERDKLLGPLSDLAKSQGQPNGPMIVFEGNLPADPSRNQALNEQIEAAKGSEQAPTQVRGWIGEPVSITRSTAVTFRPQPASHLLIVGNETPPAMGLMTTCLIGLAAQVPVVSHPEGKAAFAYLLNGHAGEAAAEEDWKRVCEALPHRIERVEFHQVGGSLAAIREEIKRRQQSPSAAHPPMFLVVFDLSRYRDLAKSEDDFGLRGFGGDKPQKPSQLFNEILKEGSAVGVHVMMWCNSYNNVDRALGRQLLKEFEMRVAFQMSAGDSSSLIDNPAASRLGQHRALLYRDDQGTTEKFRPYGRPSDEWLTWVSGQLGAGEVPPAPEEPHILEALDDINDITIG